MHFVYIYIYFFFFFRHRRLVMSCQWICLCKQADWLTNRLRSSMKFSKNCSTPVAWKPVSTDSHRGYENDMLLSRFLFLCNIRVEVDVLAFLWNGLNEWMHTQFNRVHKSGTYLMALLKCLYWNSIIDDGPVFSNENCNILHCFFFDWRYQGYKKLYNLTTKPSLNPVDILPTSMLVNSLGSVGPGLHASCSLAGPQFIYQNMQLFKKLWPIPFQELYAYIHSAFYPKTYWRKLFPNSSLLSCLHTPFKINSTKKCI